MARKRRKKKKSFPNLKENVQGQADENGFIGLEALLDPLGDISDVERTLVEEAYFASKLHHLEDKRKQVNEITGKPYNFFEHTSQVAYITALTGGDAVSVAGALLHDSIEKSLDGKGTIANVHQVVDWLAQYHEPIRLTQIVVGCTDVTKMDLHLFELMSIDAGMHPEYIDPINRIGIEYDEMFPEFGRQRSKQEVKEEFLLFMLKNASGEPGVLHVKAADRLHNFWSFEGYSLQRKRRILAETEDYVLPLLEHLPGQKDKDGWLYQELSGVIRDWRKKVKHMPNWNANFPGIYSRLRQIAAREVNYQRRKFMQKFSPMTYFGGHRKGQRIKGKYQPAAMKLLRELIFNYSNRMHVHAYLEPAPDADVRDGRSIAASMLPGYQEVPLFDGLEATISTSRAFDDTLHLSLATDADYFDLTTRMHTQKFTRKKRNGPLGRPDIIYDIKHDEHGHGVRFVYDMHSRGCMVPDSPPLLAFNFYGKNL